MGKKKSKEEKEKLKEERRKRRAVAMAEVRRRAAMFGGMQVVRIDGHKAIVPDIPKGHYMKKKRASEEKGVALTIPPTFQWSSTGQIPEPITVKEIEGKGRVQKGIKRAKRVGAKIEAGRAYAESVFGGYTRNIVEAGLLPGTWVQQKDKKNRR